ncbi:hypothetical protein [Nostoc sp.]|uniref:hypothetical protein n=1 Tax=Nostoc sp. TaxID=1180 RepID=UPI002FF565AC
MGFLGILNGCSSCKVLIGGNRRSDFALFTPWRTSKSLNLVIEPLNLVIEPLNLVIEPLNLTANSQLLTTKDG